MKYFRKGIALVLTLVITCGLYSPQVSEVEAASKKVSLGTKKMTMYVGETRAVPIKKPVKKAQIKKVKIKSSNVKVVKVSKGNLIAKKKGIATITATYQKQKASIKVTVKPKVKSTSITLNYKKKTVTTGKSFNLKVKKVKGLSTKSVSYKTSNKKVATVTSKGKVVGKAAGRATITVTSKSNKKIKAKCKVTVKRKTEIHKYGGYTIDVKPTCTKAGSKSKHCLLHPNSKSCRKSVVSIPALGHDYKKISDKKATCAETGLEVYKCSRCQNSYEKVIPKAEHVWEKEATVDVKATCEKDGKQSIHCSKCDAKKDEQVIKATGHDYKKTVQKAPTCESDGSYLFKCSNCSKEYTEVADKLAHEWNSDYTVDEAATCEEDGLKSIHCKNCKAVKDETVIQKLGHDFTVVDEKKATCTADGFKKYKCSRCNKQYEESQPMMGHKWDTEYTIDKQPTCQETGLKSIHCLNCKETKDEKTLPISGHNYVQGSCTSCGSKDPEYVENKEVISNIVDGGTYPKDTVITVPIDYIIKVNGIVVNPVNGEYTVTKPGENEIVLVSPEGDEEKKTIEVVENTPIKTEHIVDKGEYKVGQTIDVKDDEKLYVNNKEIAKEDLPYEIKKDGDYLITVEDTEGNKSNKEITVSHVHSYVGSLTKEPTCVAEGIYTYKCSSCEKSYSETVRKLQHNYKDGVCTACGKEEVVKEPVVVDDLFGYVNNENYALGSTVKVPTDGILKIDDEIPEIKGDEYVFTEEGTHYITFIDEDGDSKTITIIIKTKPVSDVSAILPNNNYTVGQGIDVPDDTTLKVNGKVIPKEELPYTFKQDGSYKVEVTDSTGKTTSKDVTIQHTHEYSSEVTSEASCTENGVITFTCSICNKKYTQVILKTGHSYTPWKVAKEPTCIEDGYNERTCTNCGDKQKDSINKLGHKYSTEFTIDKEPTCTEEGSKSKHCTVCEEVKEGSVTPIEALGHSLTEWTTDSEPTCTESGSKHAACDRKGCDYVDTQAIPATGHNYSNEFTVDKEATCTEEGSKSKHCRNDGCDAKSDITSIPMVEHSYGEYATTKESTCTEKGSEEAKCLNCDAVDTREVPALGHALDNLYTTIKPATCTEPGSKYKRCVRTGCGGGSEPVEIPAKGHYYNKTWQVDKEATCTESGLKSHHCSRDNCDSKSEITEIPAKGHSWVTEETDSEGYKYEVCSKCGEAKIPTNITMYNGDVVTGKTYVKDTLIKTVFTDLDFNSSTATFYVETDFGESRVSPIPVTGVATSYFTNGDKVDQLTKLSFEPYVNSSSNCIVKVTCGDLPIPRGEKCNITLSFGLV